MAASTRADLPRRSRSMRAPALVAGTLVAGLLMSCSSQVSSPDPSAVPSQAPSPPTLVTAPPTPVTAPSALASAPAAKTEPSTSAADLYSSTRDRLLALQERRGSAKALGRLGRLARDRPGVSGLCHAVAHDLGHAALELAGGKVGDALTDRDDVCGGGFTHGVIEQALAESDDPQAAMLTVCAPRQDGSCWHGVGHGLMFASGMDTRAALDGCDQAPSALLSNRCGEGVFMQLFSADLAAGHTAATGWEAQDPAEARTSCQETAPPHDAQCWFYAPMAWLAAHPDDFAGGLDWCRDAGSSFGSTQCARGLGSRMVKYHPDDLSIGATACEGAGRLLDACVSGMGSYWSVHWEGAVPPGDICRHLPPGKARDRCPGILA